MNIIKNILSEISVFSKNPIRKFQNNLKTLTVFLGRIHAGVTHNHVVLLCIKNVICMNVVANV